MRFIHICIYEYKMKMNKNGIVRMSLVPFTHVRRHHYNVMTFARLLKIRPDQMKDTASRNQSITLARSWSSNIAAYGCGSPLGRLSSLV